MYPHTYHQVVFYSGSSLRHRQVVKVNCTTFSYLLQLNSVDRHILWETEKCFVCHRKGHRTERCSSFKPLRVLFCSLLEDPFSKSFVDLLVWSLILMVYRFG